MLSVQLEGVVDDSQVTQPQEIEFDQPDLFDMLHVELGHNFGAALPVHRHNVVELFIAADVARAIVAG